MANFSRKTYRRFADVRVKTGFHSKFEVAINDGLVATSTLAHYEACRIPYQITVVRSYVPDWILPKQCIVIEAKGLFSKADRDKMLLLKQQYPDLDIRMVFLRPTDKITRKQTYADWCDAHGFPYCKGPDLPHDWSHHQPTVSQQRAFASAFPTYAESEITNGQSRKRVRPA